MTSLTTLHREFGALVGMPYYDMRDTILRSSLQKVGEPDSSELQKTMKLYNLNEPQSKAILNALRTEGFSLIQGYGARVCSVLEQSLIQLQTSRYRKDPPCTRTGL